MDINGWLTVITVFTTIIALLPREDLFLRFHSIGRFEKIIFAFINIALIPFLIFFEKIVQRWSCFGAYTFSWGFDPKNIAFALFYLSFLWLLFHLFSKPKHKSDKEIIDFFKEKLQEKSFEEFFKLFTKYTSKEKISENWEDYKEVLFQSKFLNKILEFRPSYLLQFWKQFNTENDFQSIFRLFLENPKSAYYSEIKEHWNSYSLLDDKPFLITILKDNIQQSIHNGILMVVNDHVSKHLLAEHDKDSVYNQKHYHPLISENEGFDLPVYHHIRFIGLMYSSAIENRIDISTMQTIYSSMVGQMIDNINVTNENTNNEYPTNYHWLINEIFNNQSHWLSSFADEGYRKERNFNKDSSYISFIPFSMSLCMSELYKGLKNRKITEEFLKRQIYHSILSKYFYQKHNIIKSSIENEVIIKIPNELIKPIFQYALNLKFAINFDDLKNEKFTRLNDGEKEILSRISKILKDNNKI